MSCRKCNTKVSATKSATCSNCGSIFHPACTELTTFASYKSIKDFWNCGSCNERFNQVSSSKKLRNDWNLIDDQNETKDIDMTDMKEVVKKIESFSINMSLVEQSLIFFSKSCDNLNFELKMAMNSISELKNKNQAYELQCNKLESEVEILKEKMNFAEQSALAYNIEIDGIPKTSDEDICNILKTVAQLLNCKLNSNDIVYSFRKPLFNNSEGKIIVQFNSKTVKDMIMNSVKSRRKLNKPIKAKDINCNFGNSTVYINDQLTDYNKRLFWLAKEVSKYYNYEHTWANMTGIFISNEGKYLRISNLKTLQKLDVEMKISALWE